jgi:hypothetical protein
MASRYRALYVAWQGHDDFHGPEAVVGTMHLSMEDYKAFMKAFMITQPPDAPSYYIRPSAPPLWTNIPMVLHEELVRAKVKGHPGLRVTAITTTAYKTR